MGAILLEHPVRKELLSLGFGNWLSHVCPQAALVPRKVATFFQCCLFHISLFVDCKFLNMQYGSKSQIRGIEISIQGSEFNSTTTKFDETKSTPEAIIIVLSNEAEDWVSK